MKSGFISIYSGHRNSQTIALTNQEYRKYEICSQFIQDRDYSQVRL